MISVIYPSRGRAQQAIHTYELWRDKADGMVQFIMAWDEDACEDYYKSFFYVDHEINISLTDSKSCVEAINNAIQDAKGNIFLVISDDFDCPEHWDTQLLQSLEGKKDFCVKTKDGFQPLLMTLPIMDRTYYERFGYIYNPIYKHWYADQEMTAVAHMLGKVENVDILFPHNHYMAGKAQKDATYERNNLSAASGKAIYQQRIKENFGLTNPVITYNQIRWR